MQKVHNRDKFSTGEKLRNIKKYQIYILYYQSAYNKKDTRLIQVLGMYYFVE